MKNAKDFSRRVKPDVRTIDRAGHTLLVESLLDYMVENGIPMPEEGTDKGKRFVSALLTKLGKDSNGPC